MIISSPVQTAVWSNRPSGVLVVLVATQLFVVGLYLPPLLKSVGHPPQTIISALVHTTGDSIGRQAR